MDKITDHNGPNRLQHYKVRRTDLMPKGEFKLPAHFKKLMKEAERTIISRYDSLGTFDRPQPTIPTHRPQRSNKKNRRRPPTEAELQDVQNSWKAVSAVVRLARGLHAVGLTLSYSVNTDTGDVAVEEFGPTNRRAHNLLYRQKIQAMWLRKAMKGSAKQRMTAQEHLYDDLAR